MKNNTTNTGERKMKTEQEVSMALRIVAQSMALKAGLELSINYYHAKLRRIGVKFTTKTGFVVSEEVVIRYDKGTDEIEIGSVAQTTLDTFSQLLY